MCEFLSTSYIAGRATLLFWGEGGRIFIQLLGNSLMVIILYIKKKPFELLIPTQYLADFE